MELKRRNNVEGLGAESLSWKEENIALRSHKGAQFHAISQAAVFT
jgi:hypothetical protein